MRICPRCKEREVKVTSNGTLYTYCGDCDIEYRKERYSKNVNGFRESKKAYYIKNREQISRKTKERLRNMRMEIINAYGNKCACCGESRYEFLCIDHVGGGGNIERRESKVSGGGLFYYRIKKSGFPSRYRLLCHNCNMSLGIYGYCPHQANSHQD